MSIPMPKSKPVAPRPNVKPRGVIVPKGMSTVDIKKLMHPNLRKSFMDHGGLMFNPNDRGRFPSSRDWNIPTIHCSRRTCVANYSGDCTMPSLIEIGSKGCKGFHKRAGGKKK